MKQDNVIAAVSGTFHNATGTPIGSSGQEIDLSKNAETSTLPKQELSWPADFPSKH